MVGKIRRRPEESACPPELECLAGAAGPYIRQDRAEFHHIGKEATEWLLRLDKDDVEAIKWTVRAGRYLRSFIKWTVRGTGAFAAAFGAVFAFGEKLAKLPETISGAISGASGAWRVLQGLIGL